mmetsp:Transcript_44126/g.111677  ORF Transcript_44126/g.111677 Transcript_44126/m.111677 type:complete len:203 (-) Transcript_44126:249-857(-)
MRAVRTVMATQARGSGRNIFDLLAQSGLTLREMIESAEETQDAHKDPAQTLDGTTRVQQNHMKDIIRKVDEEVERMAETLTQEEAQPSQPQQPASRRPSIQGSRSSSLKGGDAAATASTSYDASVKAAPPATPPTPRGRKGLRQFALLHVSAGLAGERASPCFSRALFYASALVDGLNARGTSYTTPLTMACRALAAAAVCV